MKTGVLFTLTLWMAGSALAQAPAIATDRPGFLFSSLTVGGGVVQAELGLPQITLAEADDADLRLASLAGLVRLGIGDDFELRLGAPFYNESRVEFPGFASTENGYGDFEVGGKWHLLDNAGSRPSFALIPSVILPTGEDGFTADDPVYQLNTISEWSLAGGWGLGFLAGVLAGEAGDPEGGRYYQETFALGLGRSLPAPKWNAYGEAAYVTTDLGDGADSAFLGAGVKYLPTNDVQLDLSVDRGLTGDSADWLLALGLSARFD